MYEDESVSDAHRDLQTGSLETDEADCQIVAGNSRRLDGVGVPWKRVLKEAQPRVHCH